MSFSSCACPLPATIGAITQPTCGENWGQIQKLYIQRRQSTYMIATLAAAILKANWTTINTASDATKMQATPYFENYVLPPTTPIKEGGDDNTTRDGAPIVVGASTVNPGGRFRSLPAATLKQLKVYNCEEDLWVVMVNEFGKLIGISDGTSFSGIPIGNFFVGDTGSEGKNKHNMTPFSHTLRYGWADNVKIVTPTDFNPLTDF